MSPRVARMLAVADFLGLLALLRSQSVFDPAAMAFAGFVTLAAAQAGWLPTSVAVGIVETKS